MLSVQQAFPLTMSRSARASVPDSRTIMDGGGDCACRAHLSHFSPPHSACYSPACVDRPGYYASLWSCVATPNRMSCSSHATTRMPA